ncbi:MAG TPA: bifunctional (p)ppGpp synthetase/guanosine-3',5'-bis(diphosphate) 3'-pyrophosphohydrolase [Candidatus Acidoferrales bacterium]|jgi:guanosine-3',5'-bis(diphosphate) 3'-pyrophosphohydrolase|nr:bifunctional (p)ppGpp synthetase/guanosine-3',5'-bis(diphosphate) 3'-pyrophosphohydrolase [Candidatus Acidoferrales bacterium]
MGSAGKPVITQAARRAVDLRFVELIDKVRRNRPGDDLELLRRAYDFAAEQHKTQTRLSGEPFLSHPLEVAHILADMKLDVTSLCAALLHDVVEDTKIPLTTITEQFGADVARLVEGATKISRLDLLAPETRQAENVRKMLLAMVNDVRVVVVKLADRLHNMRTLNYLDPERQQRIARETLDIYAPVANRLGMGLIRGELEDLSFRYLESEAFFELQKKLATKQKVFDKFLHEVQDSIRDKMVETGIPAEVQARVKRIYSLHLKSQKQQRTIDQVYDLLAIRVITDTVKNCYATLGVIHQIWPPVPGRFKDYIAMPRPNLYQSLHTTVIHGGQAFEVQIRTQDMHRIAEQGVAAHWKYKDGRADLATTADDQRIVWMRQLIEWVQEMQEPSEFLSTLRVDLYPEEVYTFTPMGRVVVLPRGATTIDFAYAVHTEVGHQCTGAKVNGAIVPLRHAVANGDVIEIITQKGHEPSRDWLSFVHTSRARSKIRQWINLHEREQAKDVGKRLLEKEARQAGMALKKISPEDWQRVASEYGCGRIDDLHADLGYGKWSARQVLAKASGQPLTEPVEEKPKITDTVKRMLGMNDGSILVRGHDDLMVYRSKCCNPIPGDDVIGYVTRGRGIAVHGKSCPNVQNLLYDAERRIAVEWAGQTHATFPVRLRILTEDRPGMLANITAVISDSGANIRTFESGGQDLRARIDVALDVQDRKQLERILSAIKRIPGVFDIERVYNV